MRRISRTANTNIIRLSDEWSDVSIRYPSSVYTGPLNTVCCKRLTAILAPGALKSIQKLKYENHENTR